MSVIIFTTVALPVGVNILGTVVASAAVAAAAALGLKQDTGNEATARQEAENSVDLSVDGVSEVSSQVSIGKSMSFSGNGVKVIFYQDANGEAAVRVTGKGSEAELRALGDNLAKRIVQQYAYHRLVTELKSRGMNVVEEEVEEDGTVRMRVRVYQG